MRSWFIWDFAFCFCRTMCSANSLIAPFPPRLWHVYFAALIATTGASLGTALKPARFRTLTSGLSLPKRDGNIFQMGNHRDYLHYVDVYWEKSDRFTHVCYVLPLQLPLLHHWKQIIHRLFSHLHHLAAQPLCQLVSQRLDDWVLDGGQQHHLAGIHGCNRLFDSLNRLVLISHLHFLILQHADAHGVSGVNGDHLLARCGNKDPPFC